MEYSWVDRQTRAVIVSLNLYNGNFDYYCQSTFMLEFSPGGTVVPRATLKLLSTDIYTEDYFLGWNLVKSVPEMCVYFGSNSRARRAALTPTPHRTPSPPRCVYFGVLLYIMGFLYRMYRTKRVTKTFKPHFNDFWNILDMMLFSVRHRDASRTAGRRTHTHTHTHTHLAAPTPRSHTPRLPPSTQLTAVALMLRILFLFNGARNEFRIWNPDYQELGAMYSLYSFPFVIDALTVLVFAFKSLKFFPLQKDLDMLAQTLFQAGGDLSVFVAMMIIILFGFTIMAINIFGTQSENFYLFVKAIGTLFLILLGEFDFEEMKAVDALW